MNTQIRISLFIKRYSAFKCDLIEKMADNLFIHMRSIQVERSETATGQSAPSSTT